MVATPPRIFVRGQPCRFGKSIFDTVVQATHSAGSPAAAADADAAAATIIIPHHHYDKTVVTMICQHDTVNFQEWGHQPDIDDPTNDNDNNNDNKATQSTTTLPAMSSRSNIVLGRSRMYPPLQSMACPTTMVSNNPNPPPPLPLPNKEFAQLAVVGLVLDASGSTTTTTTTTTTTSSSSKRLLVTRRPNYMRSFPGAWVLPGGGVEPGESLSEAISREVQEETGLRVDPQAWTMACAWESVYPTTGSPIRAHHIVIYFITTLTTPQRLMLCPTEVDGAIWISREQLQYVLEASPTTTTTSITSLTDGLESTNRRSKDIAVELTVPLYHSKKDIHNNNDTDDETSISLKELVGIYPQSVWTDDSGTTKLCGLAQGSRFALEEVLASNNLWC